MKTTVELEVEVTGRFCKAEPSVGLSDRIEDFMIYLDGKEITDQVPEKEREAVYEILLTNRGDQ